MYCLELYSWKGSWRFYCSIIFDEWSTGPAIAFEMECCVFLLKKYFSIISIIKNNKFSERRVLLSSALVVHSSSKFLQKLFEICFSSFHCYFYSCNKAIENILVLTAAWQQFQYLRTKDRWSHVSLLNCFLVRQLYTALWKVIMISFWFLTIIYSKWFKPNLKFAYTSVSKIPCDSP